MMMVVVLAVVVMMVTVMEGKAYRPPALRNIYVPESTARVEFCANRNCVCIWSRIYKGFQCKLGLQQSETCWNLISRSMIAPPPVLSSSSTSVIFVSLRVCTDVWKGRKESAMLQNSQVQESTPEFPELGVILLCAYSSCHLYCGAHFKSLFCWHFGVATNFIGSEVSTLLYAQLT
jgi:hypothetical protein